jgi:hypothetical protein
MQASTRTEAHYKNGRFSTVYHGTRYEGGRLEPLLQYYHESSSRLLASVPYFRRTMAMFFFLAWHFSAERRSMKRRL